MSTILSKSNEYPYDNEMEQHTLGVILRGDTEGAQFYQHISEDLFWDKRNRVIARGVKNCLDRGEVPDLMAVFRELDTVGDRESCGGLDYLNLLGDKVIPHATSPLTVLLHLDDYRLRRFAIDIRNRPPLRTGREEYEKLLAEIQGAQRFITPPATSAAEAVHKALKEIDEGDAGEVRIGIQAFDRLVGARRGDQMIIGAKTSVGKGLCLKTKIPTPSGWTTMGELRVGDVVFGRDGKPTKVTFVSDTHYLPCYEVEFSDGTKVITDNQHRWLTSTRSSRTKGSNETVVTTPEILRTLRVRQYNNHSVRNANAIQLPEANLPIHPYVLGLWLGDGTSADGTITIYEYELLDYIRAFGYPESKPYDCDVHRVSVPGLHRQLRELGLLKNKRIPEAYLRASEPQRRLLLAGLIDTDGYVSKTGCVQFYSTSLSLALQVRELIHSLGYRLTLGKKKVKGRDESTSLCYVISFAPNESVFLLRRKIARHLGAVAGKSRRSVADERKIVGVRRIDTVPTRCIQVDSPDHLYLITTAFIPTHNTNVGINFARGVIERGGSAIIHSFEMAAPVLIKRIFAHYTGIENWKVQRGKLSISEKDLITQSSMDISARNLWIRDQEGTWPQHLAAYESIIRSDPKVEILVIDYIGLVRGIPGEKERYMQLGTVSRDLKNLAKRLNVLVVALSQFNRKVSHDEKPSLENLRESGDLEQNADICVLVSAPEAQENKTAGIAKPEKLIFDIAKHRNGNTGEIDVMYDRRFCRIADWPTEDLGAPDPNFEESPFVEYSEEVQTGLL